MNRLVQFLILSLITLRAYAIILNVGEPIVDLIYQVEDQFLDTHNIVKGGSVKLEYTDFCKLIEKLQHSVPKIVPGGSGANTLRGLAKLGHAGRFIGKIGSDEIGRHFSENLQEHGIEECLIYSSQMTTQVVSIVTPDKQRTMRSFFGASVELRPDELSDTYFDEVQHLHLDGYMLYCEDVLMQTLKKAKASNASISIDLASFEVVNRFKDKIRHILKEYIDIVFANEDEAEALTGYPPEEACQEMQKVCPIAVVLNGCEGCIVGTNNHTFSLRPPCVNVVDTTGAGDLFASGFLHGFLTNKSLETCARYGNLTGATCVSEIGAQISDENWEKIKKQL